MVNYNTVSDYYILTLQMLVCNLAVTVPKVKTLIQLLKRMAVQARFSLQQCTRLVGWFPGFPPFQFVYSFIKVFIQPLQDMLEAQRYFFSSNKGEGFKKIN